MSSPTTYSLSTSPRRELFVDGSPHSSTSLRCRTQAAQQRHSARDVNVPHAVNTSSSTWEDTSTSISASNSSTAHVVSGSAIPTSLPSPFLPLSTTAWPQDDATPLRNTTPAQHLEQLPHPSTTHSSKTQQAWADPSPDSQKLHFRPDGPSVRSVRSAAPTPDSDSSCCTTSDDQHDHLKASGLLKRLVSSFQALEILPEELQKLGVLGHGAFAVVERCMYLPQQQVVAVKRMSRSKDRDVRDMVKEIALVKKIKSPYIVQYFGSGVAESVVKPDVKPDVKSEAKPDVKPDVEPEAKKQLPFLVEEYLDGGSLEDVLFRSTRSKRPCDVYSMQEGVQWLLDVGRGLQHLHSCNPVVIHRDIKLANILIQTAANGQPSCAKITDFGLAALLEPDEKLMAPSKSFCGHRSPRGSVFTTLSTPALRPSLLGAPPAVPSPRGPGLGPSPLGAPPAATASGPFPRSSAAKTVDSVDSVKMRLASCPSEWTETAMKREPAHGDRSDELLGFRVHSRKDAFTSHVGTWLYMAPEAFRNEKYNEKVDVYSFSVVMYEVLHRYCLSMSMACSADYKMFARRVATQHYRPLLNEDLPTRIQSLIKKCWHPQAALRPSMAEVVESLLLIQQTANWQHLESVTGGSSRQDCGCCIS